MVVVEHRLWADGTWNERHGMAARPEPLQISIAGIGWNGQLVAVRAGNEGVVLRESRKPPGIINCPRTAGIIEIGGDMAENGSALPRDNDRMGGGLEVAGDGVVSVGDIRQAVRAD